MVTALDRTAEAAWRLRNVEDYDRRLDRAVRRLEEAWAGRGAAALIVYETALMKSGRPVGEIREMVGRFREAFEDEDEPLTIPRVSGIMSVEGDGWFFGDGELRALTGRLLGQFQHRIAQYNYLDDREVLRRWADGYDTRLFVRRRIHGTEPVIGVVGGLDLSLFQQLRVAAGGNTLVPTPNVARALEALGYEAGADPYETLARAEGLALHLELPAPLVGEMLEEIGEQGFADFPEPPRAQEREGMETEESAHETDGEAVASEGGAVAGGAAAGEREEKPGPEARSARRAAREDPGRGAEPSRVQDPHAKDAPGVTEETGPRKEPDAPEAGRARAPGTQDAGRGE